MTDRAQAIDKPMVESKSREERIREAAYLRFLARGGDAGDEATDWAEAEAQIDVLDDEHRKQPIKTSPLRRRR